MSVTKDGDTGRWMSQIRVTDWAAKSIQRRSTALRPRRKPAVLLNFLGCVSKRKNCKFEQIFRQIKDGSRRFSGAKSRLSDAEVGSLQGFRVCLISGRLLTAQSKIETQHLDGGKDAKIAV